MTRNFIIIIIVGLFSIMLLIYGLKSRDDHLDSRDPEAKQDRAVSSETSNLIPDIFDVAPNQETLGLFEGEPYTRPSYADIKKLYSNVGSDRNSLTRKRYLANDSIKLLFRHWSPDGLSVDDLKGLLGEATAETSDMIEYNFSGEYSITIGVFKVVDGRISVSEQPMYDFESGTSADEVTRVLSDKYKTYSELRKLMRKDKSDYYYHTNFILTRLFDLWNPNGISVNQLMEIIGEPDYQTSSEIGYEFDIGTEVHKRIFGIEDGDVRLKRQ